MTDRLFLKGTFDSAKGEFAMAATFSKGVVIPELVFVARTIVPGLAMEPLTVAPGRKLMA